MLAYGEPRKRQLIAILKILGCGREAAEGGTMTFWQMSEFSSQVNPLGAGFVFNHEFRGFPVRVRVPFGVGVCVAPRSKSRP